jgi:hypothetical protein
MTQETQPDESQIYDTLLQAIKIPSVACKLYQAFNSHDELVAFIESITDASGPYQEFDGHPIVAAARQVLAKARGEA